MASSWATRAGDCLIVTGIVVTFLSKLVEVYVHFVLNHGDARPDRYDFKDGDGDHLHWYTVGL
eukprot:485252-Prorocentrum_minimum.AAC.2